MRTVGVSWRLIAAVFLGLLTAESARGQAGTTTGARASAYNGWGGAFDASPYGAMDMTDKLQAGSLSVKAHAGLWVTYDDNVYFEPTGEVDDWSVTFAPGVLVLYGNPAHNYLSANYTLQLVRYQDETDLDYDGHQLAADAHYDAAKTTLHAADRYTDTRVKVVDESEEVERQQNALTANVERYISSKTSAGVDGLYEIHNYIDDAYVDYNEYRVGGRFYYRAWPKTDVFADVGYGWVDLQPLDAGLNADLSSQFNRDITGSYGDATYQQVSIGVRGEIGRKTTASGRVGYEAREFDDDSIESIDEWVMGAGLSTKISGRMQGGVECSRRIYPWTTVPGNSAVATSVSPYVRRQVYRNRVSASASLSYEDVAYYEPTGKTSRSDETWTATAMLDWRVRRNWTLGAGYSYTLAESTEEPVDTERNRYIARAMYNY